MSFLDNGGTISQVVMEGAGMPAHDSHWQGEIAGEWEQSVVAWSGNESFRRLGDSWLIGLESDAPENWVKQTMYRLKMARPSKRSLTADAV